MQKLQTYISNINKLYQTGNAREHSYRGDLQTLFNLIIDDENIIVTNEPARIRDVGAPDYSITKNSIALGYIEAKDIDKPLNSKSYKEQFDRYKNALPNLIITDYLNFLFYKNGVLTHKIAIAKIEENRIIPIEENFTAFINHIKDFTSFVSQTITSPQNLAKLMAGKAKLLEDVLEKAITSNDENNEDATFRFEKSFKTKDLKVIFKQANQYAKTLHTISNLLKENSSNDILVVSNNSTKRNLNEDLESFIEDKTTLLDADDNLQHQDLDNLILCSYSQISAMNSKYVILIDVEKTSINELEYALNIAEDTAFIIYEEDGKNIQILKEKYD